MKHASINEFSMPIFRYCEPKNIAVTVQYRSEVEKKNKKMPVSKISSPVRMTMYLFHFVYENCIFNFAPPLRWIEF